MAKLPDALDRREVLYGRPKRPPRYADLGDDYAAAGRRLDALEAYWKIDDAGERKQRIDALKAAAIKEGVAFLLARIAVRDEVSADEWRQVADRAEELGKLRYALIAAREGGDPERAKRLELKLGLALPEPEEPQTEAPAASVEAEGTDG